MIDGGIAGNTENGSTANDVIHNQSGYYGANLKVDTDSIVTFEFLGSEAGWDNIFGYGPSDSPTNTIENHPASSSGTVLASDSASYEQSFSVFASAGSLLDFFFEVLKSGHEGIVENGNNICPTSVAVNSCIGGIPNFWLGDDGQGGIWIALDDGGGSVDDNHDDLVIRATSRSVPEPSIIALFAAGLFGIGFAARRRQS
jgi:hypothetical protein